eukprot:GHVS01074299.1.p1 GENE.GHVS01074299.1~~GHVS01074299.1.p1  ORF type:complete len:734 (-),score=121.75 GHVS01074299.1:712-2913(-)
MSVATTVEACLGGTAVTLQHPPPELKKQESSKAVAHKSQATQYEMISHHPPPHRAPISHTSLRFPSPPAQPFLPPLFPPSALSPSAPCSLPLTTYTAVDTANIDEGTAACSGDSISGDSTTSGPLPCCTSLTTRALVLPVPSSTHITLHSSSTHTLHSSNVITAEEKATTPTASTPSGEIDYQRKLQLVKDVCKQLKLPGQRNRAGGTSGRYESSRRTGQHVAQTSSGSVHCSSVSLPHSLPSTTASCSPSRQSPSPPSVQRCPSPGHLPTAPPSHRRIGNNSIGPITGASSPACSTVSCGSPSAIVGGATSLMSTPHHPQLATAAAKVYGTSYPYRASSYPPTQQTLPRYGALSPSSGYPFIPPSDPPAVSGSSQALQKPAALSDHQGDKSVASQFFPNKRDNCIPSIPAPHSSQSVSDCVPLYRGPGTERPIDAATWGNWGGPFASEKENAATTGEVKDALLSALSPTSLQVLSTASSSSPSSSSMLDGAAAHPYGQADQPTMLPLEAVRRSSQSAGGGHGAAVGMVLSGRADCGNTGGGSDPLKDSMEAVRGKVAGAAACIPAGADRRQLTPVAQPARMGFGNDPSPFADPSLTQNQLPSASPISGSTSCVTNALSPSTPHLPSASQQTVHKKNTAESPLLTTEFVSLQYRLCELLDQLTSSTAGLLPLSNSDYLYHLTRLLNATHIAELHPYMIVLHKYVHSSVTSPDSHELRLIHKKLQTILSNDMSH